jgi:hypothetical protein
MSRNSSRMLTCQIPAHLGMKQHAVSLTGSATLGVKSNDNIPPLKPQYSLTHYRFEKLKTTSLSIREFTPHLLLVVEHCSTICYTRPQLTGRPRFWAESCISSCLYINLPETQLKSFKIQVCRQGKALMVGSRRIRPCATARPRLSSESQRY